MTDDTYAQIQLQDALFELIMEHDYESISISMLCDRAGVSRMSFYRHFSQLDDVLVHRLKHLFEHYTFLVYEKKILDIETLIHAFIDHAREESKLLYALIKAEKTSLLRMFLETYFDVITETLFAKAPMDAMIRTYAKAYISGGLIQILITWFQNDMKESTEDITMLLNALIDGDRLVYTLGPLIEKS